MKNFRKKEKDSILFIIILESVFRIVCDLLNVKI